MLSTRYVQSNHQAIPRQLSSAHLPGTVPVLYQFIVPIQAKLPRWRTTGLPRWTQYR